MRRPGMCLIAILKGKNSDSGGEVVFKKTMAETFPDLKSKTKYKSSD